MAWQQHALFLLWVAIAGYIQNLTGFAFGLVLLGLASLSGAASIADVANVVSLLTLVNAAVLFSSTRPQFEAPVLWPTLASSMPGVVAGILLLHWLSGTLVTALSLLLGLTIVAFAGLLVRAKSTLAQRSSRASFVTAGAASGVLGGLFSTAGPPLVYHLYRQPMAPRAIRDTLVAVFAANAVLRLALLLPFGHVSLNALLLALETVPLVLLQTWWMARRSQGPSPLAVKRLASLLMVIVGSSLVLSSLRSMHVAGIFR